MSRISGFCLGTSVAPNVPSGPGSRSSRNARPRSSHHPRRFAENCRRIAVVAPLRFAIGGQANSDAVRAPFADQRFQHFAQEPHAMFRADRHSGHRADWWFRAGIDRPDSHSRHAAEPRRSPLSSRWRRRGDNPPPRAQSRPSAKRARADNPCVRQRCGRAPARSWRRRRRALRRPGNRDAPAGPYATSAARSCRLRHGHPW